MVLFIIGLIFSMLGILGVILNSTILLVIALIVIIIDDLIDIFGNNTNPTTVLLAILFAIGASIANHNPLVSFTFSLCAESLIMSLLGIIAIYKEHKSTYAFNNPYKPIYQNTNYYSELANIIKTELGTSDIDATIEKTCNFYEHSKPDLTDKSIYEKEKILSSIIMSELEIDDVEQALIKIREFYNIEN